MTHDDWVQIRPHIARNKSSRDRWRLVVIGLASVYEGLVEVLSLGYLSTHIRGWILFTYFDD